MTERLEHLIYEERLRELSLYSLMKRKGQENLINVCKNLEESCIEN